jgi:hypothetical protein
MYNPNLWAYLAEVTKNSILSEGNFCLERYLFLFCRGLVEEQPGIYEDDTFKITLNSQDDLSVYRKTVIDGTAFDIKVFTCTQGVATIVEWSDWISLISLKQTQN